MSVYVHTAAQHAPNPFQEIFDIFASFDSLGGAPNDPPGLAN
jgi:hypothetical protein